jgi:GNAT superfamily N-acetyltransferase
MPLSIVPLTPDRLEDLASLFGQGGDPKRCWCAFFRVRGRDWTEWTGERNRTVLERAVADTASDGRAPGLVAYDGDEAVGWTSLGPREDYDRIVHSTVLAPIDETPVWSIVCFVVGRRSRGQGIAAALLDAAIAYARDHGATTLEAYPADVPAGSRLPAANAYRGTLSMFTRAGFSVVARRQANAASAPRPIVRKSL